MFYAKLSRGVVFKQILDATTDLFDEVNFIGSMNGLELKAWEKSHTSFVHLTLNSNGFDQYDCDTATSFGLSIKSLRKILQCVEGNHVLKLTLEKNSDTMLCEIESEKGKPILEFDIKLMNLEQELFDIPKTDYAYIVNMSSEEYARIVQNLSKFGDCIQISCSQQGITFSSQGDYESGNITLFQKSTGNVAGKCSIIFNKSATEAFFAQSLVAFSKASALSDSVMLYMSSDTGLKVVFNIIIVSEDMGTAKEFGQLNFYLSPKIQ